jgi:membrane protein DedA with SNARE-associated domain
MPRSLLKKLILPLIVFGIFLSLYAIWILLDLPPEQEIMRMARGYFDRYGLITVLISATLEGLLVIGWYFPGTLVLAVGLILASHDATRFVQTGALAALGVLTAYIINFTLGKHGWYRLLLALGLREPLARAQEKLARFGLSVVFTTYWQINLASAISTAAGVLQFPFRLFLLASAVAVALWMSFWCSIFYIVGPAAMTLVGLRFVLIAIGTWIVLRALFEWRARRAG